MRAAYTAVDKAESDVEVRVCDQSRRCRPACRRTRRPRGPPLHTHLSTDYVFDGSKTTPYVEEDATAPLGVYGRSKLEGEAVVRRRMPVSALVLRTSWVYSPYGQNFVTTMLSLAQRRATGTGR